MSSNNISSPTLCPKPGAWIGQAGWLLLLAALLFLRAWPRLLQPEVWNEDAIIVSDWIRHGLPGLARIINGYLIVLPRLVSGIALGISFVDYPAVSTWLAWMVTIAICAFVAFAPSRLQGTRWVAAATLLVPSDPEVFGLPLYLLWWSAILLFALLFWSRDGKFVIPRIVLLALASLTSPVCIAVLPAFVLRGFVLRQYRGEVVVAASAIVFALVQLFAMWPLKSGGTLSPDDLLLIPEKFFGSYLVGNLFPSLGFVAGLAAALLLLLFFFSRWKSWVVVGLFYLLAVSVLMSITRVDIQIIHQTLAGPRYFFLPYVLLSWILVQATYEYRGSWPSWLAAFLMALSVANAIPSLWRNHSDLEWRKHALSCANFQQYDLPVHFDGSPQRQWHLRLNGPECTSLIGKISDRQSFPYQQVAFDEGKNRFLVGVSALRQNEWREAGQADIAGLESQHLVLLQPSGVLPSNIEFQVTRGEILLIHPEAMGANSKLLIDSDTDLFFDTLPQRSGWIALRFSNLKLPREFSARIVVTSPPTKSGAAIAFRRQ